MKLTTLSWPLILACYYFKQPINDVISGCRKRKFARVRQVIHYIAYNSGMTYAQAGELTGTSGESARWNVLLMQNLTRPINGKIQDMKLKQDIETLTI